MLDMFAVPAGQSQHTFGALVAVVTAIGAADKLEDLRKAGINSAAKLAAASRSQLREILGDVLLDKLLQPAGQGSAAARPKTRSDLPVVHPYARGSLQRIPLDGGKNSFENLDEAFLEDRYAASSKAPIESRWKTWQRLCASRSLDPLPLTQEVIFKVGALLKEGKYRSSAQYFSVAKQRHREAEYPWTDALDLAVQQAVRSISRGLGPSRPKKDLFVDRAGPDLPGRLAQAYDRLGVPREHRFAEPLSVVTVALWFLLRGIEIANVKCKDVSPTGQACLASVKDGPVSARMYSSACVHLQAGTRSQLPVDMFGRGDVHETSNLFMLARVPAAVPISWGIENVRRPQASEALGP